MPTDWRHCMPASYHSIHQSTRFARRSLYPERPNFGKTLSSACILRGGMPFQEEVYSDEDAEPTDASAPAASSEHAPRKRKKEAASASASPPMRIPRKASTPVEPAAQDANDAKTK